MEYTEGKTGRVFVVRFDPGDDILDGISRLAVRRKLNAAYFHVLGALCGSGLVVGSRMIGGKNVPDRAVAPGEWEIMGFGTLFLEGRRPKIHLHAAVGKKKKTLTGCLRVSGGVYITVECVLTEILAAGAAKKTNGAGLSLISFKRGKK